MKKWRKADKIKRENKRKRMQSLRLPRLKLKARLLIRLIVLTNQILRTLNPERTGSGSRANYREFSDKGNQDSRAKIPGGYVGKLC